MASKPAAPQSSAISNGGNGSNGPKCCAAGDKAAPTGAGIRPAQQQQQTTAHDSLVHALAGGLGAALALAVTYPLDVVRTFQQVNDSEEDDAYLQHGGRSPLLSAATCEAVEGPGAAWAAHLGPLLRPWRSATLLVQRHGPGALYRGLVPVLVSMGLSNAVFFFVSSFLKAVLARYRQRTGRSMGYLGHLATSTVAGVINVLLTTPLWVASMRAKLESGQGNDIVAIMLRVYKEEGLRALWSGTLPSLLLVVNPVLQHFCYDQLKRITLTQRRAALGVTATAATAAVTLSALEAFSFGAIAKAVATVVSYPLQVAQSRLRQQQQRQQGQGQGQGQEEQEEGRIGSRARYRGTADCLLDLWARKGLAGLFQGIEAKIVQTVLTSAFMFASYESIYRATKRTLELLSTSGSPTMAPKLLG